MNGSKSERLARLEERYAALERRHDALIEEISRARIVDEKSMSLAANEVARRLEGLNGEQARIAKMQSEMQSKEQAKTDLDKIFAKVDTNDTAVDIRLTTLEGSRLESRGASRIPNLVQNAAIGAVAAAVALGLVKLLFP